MERRLQDGDRVRVVKVPPDEFAYQGSLGNHGVVKGEPWDDGPYGWWCYVLLDGERIATEFKISELEPANPIHEVVGVVDDCGWLNRTEPNWPSFIFIGTHLAGKRIHLTVEELD